MSVYYSSVDGESISITVQNQDSIDLSTDVTVRGASTVGLSASFIVQHSDSVALSTNILVQNKGSVSLSADITVQQSAEVDLSTSIHLMALHAESSVSFTIQRSDGVDLASDIQVRNADTKGLSANVRVRNIGTGDLSTKVSIRNASTADLITSFWVNRAFYKVERINHNIIQKEFGPLSIATADAYKTIIEEDIIGYNRFSVIVAAGMPSDIVYRIQGTSRSLPNIWAGIAGQVDVDVTASDPDNMGTTASFEASLERIRVQAKNKSPGTNSRAWASLRATMGA